MKRSKSPRIDAEEVLEDLPDVDRYPTSPAAAGSARTRTSARSRTRGTERSHRAKLANSSVPRNNFSELTSSRWLRRLVPVVLRKGSRGRGWLPNWCVNINEGTGPSAAILNRFVTELDHCIVRDCEVSRGRKNAAGLFFKVATSWSARTGHCEGWKWSRCYMLIFRSCVRRICLGFA